MTVRQNERGKWIVHIEYQHPDGRLERIRRVAPSRRAGETLETRIRNDLFEGTYGAKKPQPKTEAPTLEEFAPVFLAWANGERQKPSGVERKESALRTYLLPMYGKKRLDTFDDIAVELELKKKLSSREVSSYNNVATTLNKLLTIAHDMKRIASMPRKCKLFKRVKTRPVFYDFDEFEWLVAAAAKVDWRVLLLVLLGGEAGLRRGEIIALESCNVDLKRGLITVAKSQTIVKRKPEVTATKGMRYRVVEMTDRLLAALKKHRHLNGARVIYPDKGSSTLTPKVIKNWLIRAQRLANLSDKGGTHVLRHTFCSHLAMRGAPAKTIQELAGHDDLSTTLQYMHLAPGEKARAIALLNDRTRLLPHCSGATAIVTAISDYGPTAKHQNS